MAEQIRAAAEATADAVQAVATRPVLGLVGTAKAIADASAITIIAALFLLQFFDQRTASREDRRAAAQMHAESIQERQLCREALHRVEEVVLKSEQAAQAQARAIQALAAGVRKLAEEVQGKAKGAGEQP